MRSQIAGVSHLMETGPVPGMPTGQEIPTGNGFAAAFGKATDHASSLAMRLLNMASSQQPLAKAPPRENPIGASQPAKIGLNAADTVLAISTKDCCDSSEARPHSTLFQGMAGTILSAHLISSSSIRLDTTALDPPIAHDPSVPEAEDMPAAAVLDSIPTQVQGTRTVSPGSIPEVVPPASSIGATTQSTEKSIDVAAETPGVASTQTQPATDRKKGGHGEVVGDAKQVLRSSPFDRKRLAVKSAAPDVTAAACGIAPADYLVATTAANPASSLGLPGNAADSSVAPPVQPLERLSSRTAASGRFSSALGGVTVHQSQGPNSAPATGTSEMKEREAVTTDAAGAADRASSISPAFSASSSSKEAADPAAASFAILIPIPIAGHIAGAVSGTAPAFSASIPHPAGTAASATTPAAPQHVALTSETGLSHTTLGATPTMLEIGVVSGTHGWLKIRAELTGPGEVSASLTGASASAADKLRSELPALNSYLQSEQVHLSAVTVHETPHAQIAPLYTPAAHGGSEGSGAATGSAGNTGGGSQSQREASGNTGSGVADLMESSGRRETPLSRASDPSTYESAVGVGGSGHVLPVEYGAGGSWLNVHV